MTTMTKYLYVISFDALSSLDFDYINTLPNFKEYIKDSSYCKNVYSVYPSLTYPAHSSIVTGKYPKNHGVVNNTLFQPNRKSKDWYWYRKYIKGDTFYDLAIKKGMKVAALLWPVTGRSKIQYNMPEIFPNRPWKNQIMVSLLSGSPLFQYELNKKFGHIRKGMSQPELDNFTHESMLYTINNKNPNVVLVHYTELDSMRHHFGFYSKEAKEALKSHDKRLGDIIRTIKEKGQYEESTIIVLGDHSSIDEDKIINLNIFLKERGYIDVDKRGKIKNYKAIMHYCDGSAYIYTNGKKKDLVRNVYEAIKDFNKKYDCIEDIYSRDEAIKLGANYKCTFMLEAKKGYYFLDNIEGEVIRKIKPEEVGVIPSFTKATHGYSPFKPNYTTVFMAKGKGIKKGIIIDKMSLVDEGPTIAKLLGVHLKNADGRIIEILKKS